MLGLTLILLTTVFRSLVLAATTVVLNLLSVGAAYGLIVLVFQHGVAAGLLGFQKSATIEAWVPLFLFSVLFRMRSNAIRATSGAVLAPLAAS